MLAVAGLRSALLNVLASPVTSNVISAAGSQWKKEVDNIPSWDTGKVNSFLVADAFCRWAHRAFPFAYCDVLVKRLEKVFELGSISIKAAAAVAAAVLGDSHHRYFVMHRLLAMCDQTMDDNVAARVAIDIAAEEVQEDFRRCAEVIGHDISDYHPRIAAVLKPDNNDQRRPTR